MCCCMFRQIGVEEEIAFMSSYSARLWERGENRGRKGPRLAKNRWRFQE